jgi:hypothetical protein
MSNFRFIVRLAIGAQVFLVPLLVAPLNFMAMDPSAERKLVALRLMLISLVGLMLIALALWSEYSMRRMSRLEQDHVSILGAAPKRLR